MLNNLPHETRTGEFIIKLLVTIVEFIKYTCRVGIILILISLITNGIEVQRRKINYSTSTLLESVRIDDIISFIMYMNDYRIFQLWINRYRRLDYPNWIDN